MHLNNQTYSYPWRVMHLDSEKDLCGGIKLTAEAHTKNLRYKTTEIPGGHLELKMLVLSLFEKKELL